jgi:hypothetical protein
MNTRTRFENNHQKGFLLIAAIILIFIFSTVGSMLAYSYLKKGMAVSESKQAQQALYIATSGLEIAKRAIINGTKTCAGITGDTQFTNTSLLGGKFTVKGTASTATNTLSSTMSATSTSLALSNLSGFAWEGVVKIDNEYIGYYSSSSNALYNLKRGLSGTIAASHNAAAVVSQNDCLLVSTGAVPDFTSISGQRSVQEIVSTQASAGGSLTVDTPVVMSAGSVTLRGTADLYNRGVTTSSPEYAGSNVLSGGSVILSGGGLTWVGNGSGGVTQSSTSSSLKADVKAFDTNITSANLYSYYFSQPLTTIYSMADHSYTKNNISGVAGKTVWIDGDFKLTGNGTYNIGTHSNPVVLIIDGDYDQKGNTIVNLYGLLYVTGNLDITGTADIVGEGSMAVEGEADIGGTGKIDLNPSAIGDMSQTNSYMSGEPTFHPYLFRRVVV